MKRPPDYFDSVRHNAARRWELLEKDPELAGPWHQLFKQVQSPRHVLSELLQNADDANATEAHVYVTDDKFIFEHNGEDFAPEHLESLCRFGYSNKRALHTIGFRGIGFKSTFSLGDVVELYTPTLAIEFHRARFTEPVWRAPASNKQSLTSVRVRIGDHHRMKELRKNLDEWRRNPISLLFFRNLRRLKIGDDDVQWTSAGAGPVGDSQWMTLKGSEDNRFLLIASELQAFPHEAIEEIRQERLLPDEDGIEFPPCKVEVVLGAQGRLYVVLPTGVQTELPFACNAPFVQDPARVKIKDPEISPTNRWLLRRAGELAATAMLQWLGNEKLDVADRATAYRLLPEKTDTGLDVGGACTDIVQLEFEAALEGAPWLLTENGNLVPQGAAVLLPDQVASAWGPIRAASLLDPEKRSPLSRFVSDEDQKKLVSRRAVGSLTRQKIRQALQEKRLPKPADWNKLLGLWGYLAPDITDYARDIGEQSLSILPVMGSSDLHSKQEVVRLGAKQPLRNAADWEFLAQHLLVVDPDWLKFLDEQLDQTVERRDRDAYRTIKGAHEVLSVLGLESASDGSQLIERVARQVFANEKRNLRDYVRLAHIAADVGASVGDSFRFWTEAGEVKEASDGVYADLDGSLIDLIPESLRKGMLLHHAYAEESNSCTFEEWKRWVESGRAKLRTGVPLVERREHIIGRNKIEAEASRRGYPGRLGYHYSSYDFEIEDWDFDPTFWAHWVSESKHEEDFWVHVCGRILGQPKEFWKIALNAAIVHVSSKRSKRPIALGLLPSWVIRLRELPCLPDTRGKPHKPEELMRRTAETESLMDVEPFIDRKLDVEPNHELLDKLGVRSAPTGPEQLLDKLRVLARSQVPPGQEVDRWYRRLDLMIETASTSQAVTIENAFSTERLILTREGAWTTAEGVYLTTGDDDVPGAPLIRDSVADLALWRRVKVAERPSVELALKWLSSLPTATPLAPDELKRVKALLARHPSRIWQECERWLNLAGEWVSVDGLKYSVTMQSLVAWSHLHPWVKQATADLQRQPGEVTSNPPFSALVPLATVIEERPQELPRMLGKRVVKEWLRAVGSELSRVELDAEAETARIRELARRLLQTEWVETPGLEIIPYIDGKPAGTPRTADVVWIDQALYVQPSSSARLARRVPEELGKVFVRDEFKAAFAFSFERPAGTIREYMQENFKLVDAVPESATQVPAPDAKDREESESPGADAASDPEQEPDAPDTTESPPADEPAAEDDEPPEDEAEDKPRRSQRGAAKPHIMERFALAQGFSKAENGRFVKPNGEWIARSEDAGLWERGTSNGEIVRYYWGKDQCLERDPIQLDASTWALIDKRPAQYALVLVDVRGNPSEVTGERLRKMLNDGTIKLYPATYRLVYEQEP